MNNTVIDRSKYERDSLRKEMENEKQQALNKIKACEDNILRQKGDIEKRLLRLDKDEAYTENERKIEKMRILYVTNLNLIEQEQSIFKQKSIIEHIDSSLKDLSLLKISTND